MCYIQLSESIPENIIHRSYPEGLSFLSFRAGCISSDSVKKLLQNSFPPTSRDLTFLGLAEEGFDPARSRARDTRGYQIRSWTPTALAPEYW